MNNIYILDALDERNAIIKDELTRMGCTVYEFLPDLLPVFDTENCRYIYILSPRFSDTYPCATTFAPNSTVLYFNLPSNTLTLLDALKCKAVQLTKIEAFTYANSRLTAEGALLYALNENVLSLAEQNCLILGFGHLGKALLSVFKPHCPNITVAARADAQLAEAEFLGADTILINDLAKKIGSFDIIINTIPAHIFKKPINLAKNCRILELASNIYPFDYDELKKQNIKFHILKALPSKTFKLSAARLLLKQILLF